MIKTKEQKIKDVCRNDMIGQNLGLVHSCAGRFRGRGIEYDDLYSAGCVGLVKAIDAFDAGRGLRLSTYAVPVILGEIKRLFRDGGSVKISRALKELSLRTTRERANFAALNSREPTVFELAEILCVTPEETAEAISAGTPPVSLTENEETGGGQLDIKVDAPEEAISDSLSLKQVIEKLEKNDRRLIVLRYFKEKTQVETAKKLGMTQVQVSRREKKILLELRKLLR